MHPLQSLRAFVTVAREGSVSRAAIRLHLTQPAVSLKLKQLQDELGLKLFLRKPQGLVLTPDGQALLPPAEKALAAVAAILLTARLGSALPSVAQDWLLPAFLAPLLGGTLLAGGYVSVFGTFLGATLISVLQNGLVLIEISGFWIQFFLGLTLLAVVVADKYRTDRAEKRAKGRA